MISSKVHWRRKRCRSPLTTGGGCVCKIAICRSPGCRRWKEWWKTSRRTPPTKNFGCGWRRCRAKRFQCRCCKVPSKSPKNPPKAFELPWLVRTWRLRRSGLNPPPTPTRLNICCTPSASFTPPSLNGANLVPWAGTSRTNSVKATVKSALINWKCLWTTWTSQAFQNFWPVPSWWTPKPPCPWKRTANVYKVNSCRWLGTCYHRHFEIDWPSFLMSF